MDPEESPEQLREYLANSLSRLERLTDLNAADFLIECERQVALKLIAKLEPNDLDAVLRAWPRSAKLLEGDLTGWRSKPSDHGPN